MLSSAPSFLARFMVRGRVNEAGALVLFVAPTTGDETHPIAIVDGFKDAIRAGGAASGTGTLTRSKKLPPEINWQVGP